MAKVIKEDYNAEYGSWRVIAFDKIDSHGDARYFCECGECGKIKSVKAFTLRNGDSTRCRQCADRERRNKRGAI